MKSPLLAPNVFNIFVYGTLKPDETNYQHYCGGKVQSQTSGYTRGNLYALPVGYPAMTQGDNEVKGVLLGFNDPNILAELDKLEGYQSNRPAELNEYYRRSVPIYSLNNHQLLGSAWAYFMTIAQIKRHQGTIVKSGWWTGVSC